MNNKILIGSIIAVAILILMPNISAIQMITIEDGTYNELVEHLDFKDIKEIKGLEQIKHSFLYNLVKVFLDCRWTRIEILRVLSCDIFSYDILKVFMYN